MALTALSRFAIYPIVLGALSAVCAGCDTTETAPEQYGGSESGGTSASGGSGGATGGVGTGGSPSVGATGGVSTGGTDTGGAGTGATGSDTGGAGGTSTGGTSTGGTSTGGTGGAEPGTGGGSGGTNTGGTGTGGTGGTGGSGDPAAVACPAATEALLLDFALGMGGAGSTVDETFGDFTTTFSGGTYFYPGGALASDLSEENWHLEGDLNNYGGFGLYFASCSKVDASAFSGIKFTISGTTDGKAITLTVGTAGNEISTAWLQAHGEPDANPSFGRCTPAGNKYDGSCVASSYQMSLTGTPTTVEVPWSAFTGGKPEASVNPSEITFISWAFTPPAGAGTSTITPYPVDVAIDDIGFIP